MTTPDQPAELDCSRYPLGVKVSDNELAAVPIWRHDWHGEGNYSIPSRRPHSRKSTLWCGGP